MSRGPIRHQPCEQGGIARQSNTRHRLQVAIWILFSLLLLSLSTAAAVAGGFTVIGLSSRGSLGRLSSTSLVAGFRAGLRLDAVNLTEIPHNLHHIFLSGEAEYRFLTLKNHMKASYRNSCLNNHPEWKHYFWVRSEAEVLVKQDFPWFWDTWANYTEWVMQGDVLRYMVLYKYGGLYLDLDVECFSPADDSLRDSTIVLQGSGVEGVTNAIMASAPLNAFWLEVLRICKERATKPEYSWDPVQSTGPKAVGEAIRQLFNVSSLLDLGFIGKVLELEDTQTKINTRRQGDWFAPCWYEDGICWRRFNAGLANGTWDMEGLVGAHRFTGSWG